jgi:hypothetical protein
MPKAIPCLSTLRPMQPNRSAIQGTLAKNPKRIPPYLQPLTKLFPPTDSTNYLRTYLPLSLEDKRPPLKKPTTQSQQQPEATKTHQTFVAPLKKSLTSE